MATDTAPKKPTKAVRAKQRKHTAAPAYVPDLVWVRALEADV